MPIEREAKVEVHERSGKVLCVKRGVEPVSEGDVFQRPGQLCNVHVVAIISAKDQNLEGRRKTLGVQIKIIEAADGEVFQGPGQSVRVERVIEVVTA